MSGRERWFGTRSRTGILQRLGNTLIGLSFVVIVVGYRLAARGDAVYAAMVAAHAMAYVGFVVAAIGDVNAGRPFSWNRLVIVASIGLCYAISGPILMSAVQAVQAAPKGTVGRDSVPKSMIERRGDTWIQIRDVDGDDERFDVLFWQAQGPEAIFRAAWELVETAWEIKGAPSANLRLDRSAFSIETIK